MEKKIVHINDLCKTCGHFAYGEPDTHGGHDYGCNHPDNTSGDKQCMASACPIGFLAEAEHFEEILGTPHEEAVELDNESEHVVVNGDEPPFYIDDRYWCSACGSHSHRCDSRNARCYECGADAWEPEMDKYSEIF